MAGELSFKKFPHTINFSLNPLPVKVKKEDVDVRYIVLRLLVEETYLSGTYNEVAALIAFPDDDTTFAFWDIGGQKQKDSAIHAFFTGFDLPAYDGSSVTAFSESIRRFKLKYDWYNFAGALFEDSTSSAYHVLMGGVQWQEFPSAGFWRYAYKDDPRFLTWRPNSQRVSTAMQNWLSYYVLGSGITSIKLNCTIDFPLSSSSSVLSTTSVTQHKCYNFPAGYDQLNLDSIDTLGTATRYTLQLLDQSNNIISDARTFIIDRSHQPFERFFMFKNSLGGIDCLRTLGVGAKNVDFTKTKTERTLDYRYTVINGQRFTDNILEQESIKVSSGYSTAAEAEYGRELYRSPAIVEDIRGRWTPVEIKHKPFEIFRDDDMLFHFPFEYDYRFQNPVFGSDAIDEMPPSYSEANDNADYPA